MGRYLFEYVLPAIAMFWMAFYITKFWFTKLFPSQIREFQDITKQSEKTDKEIDKIKWSDNVTAIKK